MEQAVKSYIDITDDSLTVHNNGNIKTNLFPLYFVSAGHWRAGSKYFTERSSLDNYLLIYTNSGRGLIKTNDGEAILEKGSAIMISCQKYHYYKTISDENWDFFWIHIKGNTSAVYYDYLSEGEFSDSIITETDSYDLKELFNSLILKKDSGNVLYNMEICEIITAILTKMSLLKFKSKEGKLNKKHSNQVKIAIDYIKANFAGNISIDDIISKIYLSKFYFLRLFKENTGVSLYDYLIRYRITASKFYLTETNLSVDEISTAVGFSDANSYIRSFKKIQGTTPNRYRISLSEF